VLVSTSKFCLHWIIIAQYEMSLIEDVENGEMSRFIMCDFNDQFNIFTKPNHLLVGQLVIFVPYGEFVLSIAAEKLPSAVQSAVYPCNTV
jgi:hypothetical protein